MTIEEKLGKEITIRRRKQLISQEDFARKAGITRSYMSHIAEIRKKRQTAKKKM